MPRLIPVIDVMGGQVVRAVGGRRNEYRPIRSRLTASTDPVDVARAMLDFSRSDELYVADLDAITGTVTDLGWLDRLLPGCHLLWVDVGIRTADDLSRVPDSPGIIPVCSFETVQDLALFHEVKDRRLRSRVAASVELAEGRVLGDLGRGIREQDRWWGLIEEAMHAGCADVILIDLSGVGTGAGATTAEYCRGLKGRWPHLRIMTGGGVRNWDDVRRLEHAGADAVLVASALHDGTLTFPRPASSGRPR